LFFVFLVAPIAIVVAVSFTPQAAVSFPYQGFSFRWYVRLVEYRPFVDSLFTSLYLALSSALVAVTLAVPAALALGRGTSQATSATVAFLLAPIAIPALVIGLSLLYYLSNLGLGVSYTSLLWHTP
jgi:putative spermidine/putrescine transport system permease protein